MICKLKKPIYRLEQSFRAWFEKFSIIISGNGSHRCHYDHSAFVLHMISKIALLAYYMDDI